MNVDSHLRPSACHAGAHTFLREETFRDNSSSLWLFCCSSTLFCDDIAHQWHTQTGRDMGKIIERTWDSRRSFGAMTAISEVQFFRPLIHGWAVFRRYLRNNLPVKPWRAGDWPKTHTKKSNISRRNTQAWRRTSHKYPIVPPFTILYLHSLCISVSLPHFLRLVLDVSSTT